MSRHVVGEPTLHAATAAALSFGLMASEPALHKMVEITCDGCGTVERTFDRRTVPGWTQRLGAMFHHDLCPECSAKPIEDTGGVRA